MLRLKFKLEYLFKSTVLSRTDYINQFGRRKWNYTNKFKKMTGNQVGKGFPMLFPYAE